MHEPLGVRIAGTGRALPKRVLTNEFFADRLDTTDEWIRDRTGICERHVVGEGETTATLATDAARDAIADAGLDPSHQESGHNVAHFWCNFLSCNQ